MFKQGRYFLRHMVDKINFNLGFKRFAFCFKNTAYCTKKDDEFVSRA